ncbi:unnamed protein product [Heterobilharzia americana]|nr:unnamed protein product [Heterobilharzia americana]
MKLIHILSSCFLVFSICLQAVNSQPWNPQLEKLLKMHNDYRHMLMECKVEGQPPAKYLPDLTWDNDLAYYAQSLADECYFHHNNVHLSKYKYVGQNIAGYQTVERAMYEWFIEHKDYTFATGYCSNICGHYTQLVWQNTTHVGCGVRDCKGTSFPYGLSVVCNYGPGGNYDDEKPYQTKSSSECHRTPIPSHTTAKPSVIKTARTPSVIKKLPKPNWTTLLRTWNEYIQSKKLTGTVKQTCICIE